MADCSSPAAVIVLHVFQKKSKSGIEDSETRYGSDRGQVKEGY